MLSKQWNHCQPIGRPTGGRRRGRGGRMVEAHSDHNDLQEHVMSRLIRTAGRRFGRATRNAGRWYVEAMAKCDPNGIGYYVW